MTTMVGSISVAVRRPRRTAIHVLAVRVGLALARWGRGPRPDRDRVRLDYERQRGLEARQRDALRLMLR